MIDETAPWSLAKVPELQGRLGTVLYNLLEAIRFGAVMLVPFIPATAEEILSELNTDRRDFASLETFGALRAGDTVGDSRVLFVRVDEAKELAAFEAERQKQLDALRPAEAPAAPESRRAAR